MMPPVGLHWGWFEVHSCWREQQVANCQSHLSINAHAPDIKSLYKSYDLINGAITSTKITTSSPIRGPKLSD